MANQSLWQHTASPKTKFNRHWWVAIFTFLVVAAQCGTPMPPLPETSQNPAITVAILSPTEGELASFGRMFRNGIAMAFDAQNQENGADGYRLEWRTYNTDCTFQTGKQTAQQAINDGAKFIIGPICSEAAVAAATVAETGDVLLIAPAATNPLVTVNNQGNTRPTVFRVAYTSNLQGQAAAQFATESLGKNKAAIIIETGDNYALELVDAFVPRFIATGGEITYQNTFTPGVTNIADLLAEVVQSKADLIYLPVNISLTNQIGSELSQLANPPILLGSDTWTLGELNSSTLAGSYYPTHFTPLNEQPAVQEWATTYRSKFAVEPDTLAALGFDAANILAQAIKESNSMEPVSVANAISNEEFHAVTGPITFDAQNNPVKPVPFLSVGEELIIEYVMPVP